jgi:hypothetical protein
MGQILPVFCAMAVAPAFLAGVALLDNVESVIQRIKAILSG